MRLPALSAGLVGSAALVIALSAGAENAIVAHDADLRAGAGFGRDTVGRLRQGEADQVLDERIGWVRVRAGEVEGWARYHVLSRPAAGAPIPSQATASASALAGSAAPPSAETASIDYHSRPEPILTQESPLARRTLYLRPVPSFDVALAGRVLAGETYTVLVDAGEWTQVESQGGAVGWVVSEAMSASPTLAASPPTAAARIALR